MYIKLEPRYIRYIVYHQWFKALHFPLQGRYKPLQPLHFSRAGWVLADKAKYPGETGGNSAVFQAMERL
jgi:hypothetical protein